MLTDTVSVVIWTTSSIPQKLVRSANSWVSHPRPTETLGWSPAVKVLTVLPGGSDEYQSLRSTAQRIFIWSNLILLGKFLEISIFTVEIKKTTTINQLQIHYYKYIVFRYFYSLKLDIIYLRITNVCYKVINGKGYSRQEILYIIKYPVTVFVHISSSLPTLAWLHSGYGMSPAFDPVVYGSTCNK